MTSSSTSTNNWEAKTSVVLAVLLAVFALAKSVHLNTPLFHDELEVYGQAFFYMLDHGPSMMPGDIEPILSRGHPLFFVFFVSWVSSWFGSSFFQARCVLLFLSLATLVSAYLLGKELVSKRVGLLAAVLLSFQPLFFAQSILILPEVMLCLLATLSLLFYVQKKYWLYFLVASLMILTKETGVVVFGGIALNEWHKAGFKITLPLIRNVSKWAAPISAFILFLFLQKYQNGWVLYPFHTGFISFELPTLYERFSIAIIDIFSNQGRFICTIAVALVLMRNSIAQNKQWFNNHFLPIAVCAMMVAFSALNFYMTRYLTIILPLVSILVLSVLHTQRHLLKFILFYFLVCLPISFNYSFFKVDDNMGYLVVVENMKRSFAKLDNITEGKAVKVYARFPDKYALLDPRYGFTSNPNYIVTDQYDESVDYIMKNSNYALPEGANRRGYALDTTLFKIKTPETAKKLKNIELLYESQYFYNIQRIFKTNN